MKRLSGNRSVFRLFTTGREVYANIYALSLSLDPRYPGLMHGYDGDVEGGKSEVEDWWEDDYKAERVAKMLTPEERAEIADVMIARWQQWRETGQ